MTINPATPIRFRYKNHEGKTRVITVIVKRIWFGQTKWHPEPQWFIRGLCTEHNANRDFALTGCDFLTFKQFGNGDTNRIWGHDSDL